MEDSFLADNMMIHIEREIVPSFTFDYIIDDFKSLKEDITNPLTLYPINSVIAFLHFNILIYFRVNYL